MENNIQPKLETDSTTVDHKSDFVNEISKKMRVPEKISIDQDMELKEAKNDRIQLYNNFVSVEEKLDYMHVPKRILVNSNNIESDISFDGDIDLNLNNLDENNLDEDNLNISLYNDQISQNFNSFNKSSYKYSSKDEVKLIKNQLNILNGKIADLEMKYRNNSNMKIIFCALGLTYIVIKGLFWLGKK